MVSLKFCHICLGNAKCGKSSLIKRYVSQLFNENYKTTIGADYERKDLQVQIHSTSLSTQKSNINTNENHQTNTKSKINIKDDIKKNETLIINNDTTVTKNIR